MNKTTRPEDLLQVLQAPAKSLRSSASPLAAEMPVDPDTAPYLVTSSRSLLWHTTHIGGKVRAAVRTAKLDTLYTEIVQEICTTSVQVQWGSVFQYDLDGVKHAVEYIRGYGIDDVEILCPPNDLDGVLKDAAKWDGVDIHRVGYLPPRTILVVPKDRDYLGTVIRMGDGDKRMILVHNPSRGMAVVGWNS